MYPSSPFHLGPFHLSPSLRQTVYTVQLGQTSLSWAALTHRREPEKILGPLGLDEDTTADLRLTIGRRLTPKPVKVRADVEVKCFAYQGIEAIRKALAAGEGCSTDEVPIKIRLVAPPLYVMSTTSTDKTAAIEVMEKAVEKIGEVIAAEKGDLTIKMAVGLPCLPHVVSSCFASTDCGKVSVWGQR